jgi:hypothetical protein
MLEFLPHDFSNDESWLDTGILADYPECGFIRSSVRRKRPFLTNRLTESQSRTVEDQDGVGNPPRAKGRRRMLESGSKSY